MHELVDAFDKIEIKDKGLQDMSEDQSYSEDYLFYKELKRREKIHRVKRKWIINDHLNELKYMLEKYKNRHFSIRKALKLSYSTYRKILKELQRENLDYYVSKRQVRFRSYISEEERKCIELLVTPPRPPITIRSI